ncbi:HMG-box domain-containing protein [Winogradskyella sediminis]|uniref:hypothetical protein n=1 Tax=Winogradskyella sediminis TaxID=1382466 RepID=UPI000E2262F3|nr:hypothetical protein [Winogradskyella sediminis]REG87690.1 hypothetical protein C8N41_102535 [Winogradskyella sediminis]
MDQINNLIALKSMLELNMINSNLNILLAQISNKILARKIINELKRRNYGHIITLIDEHLYQTNQNPLCYHKNDIKQFDFETIENSNIKDLKCVLGISILNFNTAKDISGEDTDFLIHWDNLNRFAVYCRKHLVEIIKEHPEYPLYIEKEIKEAKLGTYTKFTISCQKVIERLYEDRVNDRSHLGEYKDWYMDAYDNDASNLWNND